MGIYCEMLDFSVLKRGDIVRHKRSKQVYVVTANYGERVTAIASADMTNPSEWEVFAATGASQETEGTALMPDLAEAISGVPLVQQLKPTFPCLGCDEPVTERDTYCAPCKKHNDEIAARGDKEWAERACKVCNRMHPDHSPTCTYYL